MLDGILDYLSQYENIFIWLGIVSIFMFIASIVIIPIIINKIPKDYFINDKYHHIDIGTPIKFIIFILKNTLGLLLVIAGIVMLITPGQGIISILMGLFLMNFKGKYKLEQKLIASDITFKSLNWIRKKGNKEDFLR